MLGVGEQKQVWSAETPTPGATMAATTIPIALCNPPAQGQAVSVSVAFSAAPGAFEVDLLTADQDTSGPAQTSATNLASWQNYVQKATVTSVNASNVARMEVTGIKAKFCALQLVSRANSVSATAIITA
jgi:hypothetical protein